MGADKICSLVKACHQQSVVEASLIILELYDISDGKTSGICFCCKGAFALIVDDEIIKL